VHQLQTRVPKSIAEFSVVLRDTVEIDGSSLDSGSPLCGIKVASIVFIRTTDD